MIATCTKCRELHEAPETEPLATVHLCARCTTITELLGATEALNQHLKSEMMLGRLNIALVRRDKLQPVIARVDLAIAEARAKSL